MFVVEEEGLGRAAFSAEVIALSRLWVWSSPIKYVASS
jgi:hypothetical protein